MKLNRPQQGFTLIELIVVIVILGILAATALPKFVDFKGDAEDAALSGIAGAVQSTAAINYAAVVAGKSTASLPTASVCTSAALGALMSTGWPAGYSIANKTGGATCAAAGATQDCTLTQTSSTKTQDIAVTCDS